MVVPVYCSIVNTASLHQKLGGRSLLGGPKLGNNNKHRTSRAHGPCYIRPTVPCPFNRIAEGAALGEGETKNMNFAKLYSFISPDIAQVVILKGLSHNEEQTPI